jgi:lysophospholipase L1-like esterase
VVLCALCGSGAWAQVLVKEGDSVAFLGDSITQGGAGSPVGYVRLVMGGLEAVGVKAQCIPAGISGHKSNQMLARLQKDVLDKKPTFMTLSCGVNDVWHGANGVPLDKYKENITAIVDKCAAAGVKVVMLTATMIHENQANAENQKLVPYNDFLKALAAERKLPLADLNADMQAALKAPHKGNLLTTDGVHMNPLGNEMMAKGVLRALGVDAAGLAKVDAAWGTIGGCEGPRPRLTLGQYKQLAAIAGREGMSLDELLGVILNKAVEATLARQPK